MLTCNENLNQKNNRGEACYANCGPKKNCSSFLVCPKWTTLVEKHNFYFVILPLTECRDFCRNELLKSLLYCRYDPETAHRRKSTHSYGHDHIQGHGHGHGREEERGSKDKAQSMIANIYPSKFFD